MISRHSWSCDENKYGKETDDVTPSNTVLLSLRGRPAYTSAFLPTVWSTNRHRRECSHHLHSQLGHLLVTTTTSCFLPSGSVYASLHGLCPARILSSGRPRAAASQAQWAETRPCSAAGVACPGCSYFPGRERDAFGDQSSHQASHAELWDPEDEQWHTILLHEAVDVVHQDGAYG